ncbi:antibiotic biosynthesis monooxygenase [Streptomyces sp. NPDC004542]|uniref:putative quinol monooxygenase n=1 Tax=Streptomyces sp. NPDC004542 TaxID=3154281 RepID=UPI0033AE050F
MTAIRVLHQFHAGEEQEERLLAYTRRLRKETGCLEAEHYRSVVAPASIAVVELWEDQYLYGEHWARALEEAEPDVVLGAVSGRTQSGATSEFYRHEYYQPGRVWLPVAQQGRTQKVFWPAAGAVRVLYQGSPADTDAVLEEVAEGVRETRREPGCLQFEWFRGTEFPGHVLVLELWQDQTAYDAHWLLRISTGSGGDGGEQAPRRQGTNGLEFYRGQEFTHLYDRWLPADVARRSETVVWPG